jgi:hypothetical protein
MGILKEETDTTVTLLQGCGQTVRIDKASITERRSLHRSSMSEFGGLVIP